MSDTTHIESVVLTLKEYREITTEAAELRRRLAQAELALAERASSPNCARHAHHTNPLPCPHCMADWIVSATNAYAKRDWEALRATLYRNVQQARKARAH